jgi:hypothetical protein
MFKYLVGKVNSMDEEMEDTGRNRKQNKNSIRNDKCLLQALDPAEKIVNYLQVNRNLRKRKQKSEKYVHTIQVVYDDTR